MQTNSTEIQFARLPEISPDVIAEHMSDPRLATHLPLWTGPWDVDTARGFVSAKEAYWLRDGLGHWAFLADGVYVGWGGFQREGDEWDFGLVLRPDSFWLGPKITLQVIEIARADERVPYMTIMLPPSRRHLSALKRIGAKQVGEAVLDGERFLKFRLATSSDPAPVS